MQCACENRYPHHHHPIPYPHRVDAIANGRDVAPLMRQTQAWVTARRAELQHLMWQHCGIVRSRHGMKEAFWKMATMYVETKAVCESMGVNTQLQELLNLVCVCAEGVCVCVCICA